jgi:hypothetical protein
VAGLGAIPGNLWSLNTREGTENPCRGKWNLANSPEEYPYSSAYFYATGKQGLYAITNYMELRDVDLSKLVE